MDDRGLLQCDASAGVVVDLDECWWFLPLVGWLTLGLLAAACTASAGVVVEQSECLYRVLRGAAVEVETFAWGVMLVAGACGALLDEK